MSSSTSTHSQMEDIIQWIEVLYIHDNLSVRAGSICILQILKLFIINIVQKRTLNRNLGTFI